MVVEPAKFGFSTNFGFRLLFALFAEGKRTKKLMKMRAPKLLIFSTEKMCKTDEKLADLLRIPQESAWRTLVQKPVEFLRETIG